MLFLPFTKNWWSAFVRGDDNHPRNDGEGETGPEPSEGSDDGRREARGGRQDDRRVDDRGGDDRRGGDERRGRSRRDNDDRRRGRGRGRDEGDESRDDDELELEDGAEDEGTVVLGGAGAHHDEDDPLSPAYDLDHGEPLDDGGRTSTRRQVANRAEVRSAKEFFNGEILYRYDILDSDSRQELKGSYRVELKGYSGGIWTVNVGDAIEVVNRREEADVVLTMQQRDFLQLVNGEINPQLAIVAQKLRLSGDVRKGVTAQILFSPLGE